MKELEYPFDSSFLLQKRRKLKKALLADGSARMENALPCWAVPPPTTLFPCWNCFC